MELHKKTNTTNRRASFTCFISLCLLALFFFGCGGGGGEAGSTIAGDRDTLSVQWNYPGPISATRGFKLYLEGQEICSTETFPPFEMNCDTSALDIVYPATFTMTAYDDNFRESPHSAPFTVYKDDDQ